MEACQAFARVHPTDGEINPDGVYPPTSATAPPMSASSIFQQPEKPIEEMSIKELRQMIVEAGLECKDCLEKQDLQQRARQAREKLDANPI